MFGVSVTTADGEMKPEQEALSQAKECSEPAVEALPGNQGGEGRGKEFLFDDLFEMFC